MFRQDHRVPTGPSCSSEELNRTFTLWLNFVKFWFTCRLRCRSVLFPFCRYSWGFKRDFFCHIKLHILWRCGGSLRSVKLILEDLLPHITFIFNNLFTTSTFSEYWQRRKMVPIQYNTPYLVSLMTIVRSIPFLHYLNRLKQSWSHKWTNLLDDKISSVNQCLRNFIVRQLLFLRMVIGYSYSLK